MSQSDEETTYIEYTSLALHLADEYFLNNNSRFRSILFVLISMNIITLNWTKVLAYRTYVGTVPNLDVLCYIVKLHALNFFEG